MNEPDDYTRSVFEFLDRMPFDRIYTVNGVCKPENQERFIAAIKLYMDCWPYGAGVSFIDSEFKTFRKIRIPDEAIKELYGKH